MALDTSDQQKTFNWEDPLDLASRLTEEERMVWESARAYAREKLLPRVVSAFAEERFDREIMSEMGALGFLGATLPEQYGGAGVSHVAYGLIAREIEAIDGFDPDLGWAVLHIILAHHGQLEHGSPVTPATREATLVHMMDNLGGKLGSFDRIERTLADGQAWSGFDRGIDGSAFFRDRAA